MITTVLGHCSTFVKRLVSSLLTLFLSQPTQKLGTAASLSLLLSDLDYLETEDYQLVGGTGNSSSASTNAASYAGYGVSAAAAEAQARGKAALTNIQFNTSVNVQPNYAQSSARATANATGESGNDRSTSYSSSSSYYSHVGNPPGA